MPDPQRIPAHKLRPGDVIVMPLGGHEGSTRWYETVKSVGPSGYRNGVWSLHLEGSGAVHHVHRNDPFTVIERGPE